MTTVVRKTAAYGPAVVGSTMLVLVFGGVLPAALAGGVLVGGLGVAAVLLAGGGESIAVRLLWRARTPTAVELATLAPALAMLPGRGGRAGPWRLLVSAGGTPAVHGVGRGTLVVSAGLPAALRERRLRRDDGVALLGRGARVVLSGAVRSDPAIALWTLPAQLICGAGTGIGRVVARMPLVRTIWAGRAVVATIAAVQAAASAQWIVAGVLAGVTAVSYLGPTWARAWAREVRNIGDAPPPQAGFSAGQLAPFNDDRRPPGATATVAGSRGPLRPDPGVEGGRTRG
ncbi:hypothetical protein V3N99_21625 [Dermatophilaceae bacterium Soc4.6]